jgi:hypothetical protein
MRFNKEPINCNLSLSFSPFDPVISENVLRLGSIRYWILLNNMGTLVTFYFVSIVLFIVSFLIVKHSLKLLGQMERNLKKGCSWLVLCWTSSIFFYFIKVPFNDHSCLVSVQLCLKFLKKKLLFILPYGPVEADILDFIILS